MRHKVKKNKAYRDNQLDDERIGIDKKTQHRKERRVFNSSNIREAYSIITQNTKELDALDALEQQKQVENETDELDGRQKFG